MANDGREDHDRRRRIIGARDDADRESSDKPPRTEAQRAAFIDREMDREDREYRARQVSLDRRQRLWETVRGNVISGVIVGLFVAFCTWLIARLHL
jgi:hypothetical protein